MIRLIRDNVERIAVTDEQAQDLKKRGFIRLDEEKAVAPVEQEPHEMTVAQLRAKAKKLGITGASSLNKSELLTVLKGE
jgi:hypothetical protein